MKGCITRISYLHPNTIHGETTTIDAEIVRHADITINAEITVLAEIAIKAKIRCGKNGGRHGSKRGLKLCQNEAHPSQEVSQLPLTSKSI